MEKPENNVDVNFSMMCLNSRQIERETILYYIGYRLDENITGQLSNIEIHKKLVRVLDAIKRDSRRKTRRSPYEKRIIMDD